MSITRYEPWGLHRELLNEFNRYFDRAADASSSATADWAPPVDIEEYADKFVIYADVPGIEPDSIEVTLEKGVLTLSGSRELAVESGGNIERKRTERASGRFLRRFVLPDTVDSDSVSASGRNGVLQIAIPKRPQAQPRKITVTH
ncbi:MAG: Hsp20/alpha crystallin family protein [Sinimarinibacterium flocculans]|uniref:Heat shock protein Hsp20 n=1 Tax=Sinimarinibacterium flocculans TaxID=985250 RepID=A0A318E952_9GAMM|nr:Hsp20/alpha crystallin family protein [Sinimarinibacterium flocculans]MEC9363521.1 Hsp20/alpha crystallin family protein [Pseudomonadota bacterium]PXV67828.1 heat shock protein Hsp20 [Sinimarinibacterium flocculans]